MADEKAPKGVLECEVEMNLPSFSDNVYKWINHHLPPRRVSVFTADCTREEGDPERAWLLRRRSAGLQDGPGLTAGLAGREHAGEAEWSADEELTAAIHALNCLR